MMEDATDIHRYGWAHKVFFTLKVVNTMFFLFERQPLFRQLCTWVSKILINIQWGLVEYNGKCRRCSYWRDRPVKITDFFCFENFAQECLKLGVLKVLNAIFNVMKIFISNN
jgi:hypothetical protein